MGILFTESEIKLIESNRRRIDRVKNVYDYLYPTGKNKNNKFTYLNILYEAGSLTAKKILLGIAMITNTKIKIYDDHGNNSKKGLLTPDRENSVGEISTSDFNKIGVSWEEVSNLFESVDLG